MFYLVEAGFQPAMGVTLERGRFITAQDDERAPVVIDIDDVFARTYFPNENPIGKHIHLAGFEVQAEIVGVVGHVKQWGLDTDAKSAIEAQFDYPFMQLPEKLMPLAADAVAVVLRTEGDPTAVMGQVRQRRRGNRSSRSGLQRPDDGRSRLQFICRAETLHDASRRFRGTRAGARVRRNLRSDFVSGRPAHSRNRCAYGPGRAADDVLRLVIGHGARMALVGVAIGIVAAMGLTRLMANQLFGVSPHDPFTFAGVAVLLIIVAVAACYIPARRAMRVDPIIALRYE